MERQLTRFQILGQLGAKVEWTVDKARQNQLLTRNHSLPKSNCCRPASQSASPASAKRLVLGLRRPAQPLRIPTVVSPDRLRIHTIAPLIGDKRCYGVYPTCIRRDYGEVGLATKKRRLRCILSDMGGRPHSCSAKASPRNRFLIDDEG